MSLTVNLEILDRVKAVIAETGRINLLFWTEVRGSVITESVCEIRGLSLLGNYRTTFCIGGSICYLAPTKRVVGSGRALHAVA